MRNLILAIALFMGSTPLAQAAFVPLPPNSAALAPSVPSFDLPAPAMLPLDSSNLFSNSQIAAAPNMPIASAPDINLFTAVPFPSAVGALQPEFLPALASKAVEPNLNAYQAITNSLGALYAPPLWNNAPIISGSDFAPKASLNPVPASTIQPGGTLMKNSLPVASAF